MNKKSNLFHRLAIFFIAVGIFPAFIKAQDTARISLFKDVSFYEIKCYKKSVLNYRKNTKYKINIANFMAKNFVEKMIILPYDNCDSLFNNNYYRYLDDRNLFFKFDTCTNSVVYYYRKGEYENKFEKLGIKLPDSLQYLIHDNPFIDDDLFVSIKRDKNHVYQISKYHSDALVYQKGNTRIILLCNPNFYMNIHYYRGMKLKKHILRTYYR